MARIENQDRIVWSQLAAKVKILLHLTQTNQSLKGPKPKSKDRKIKAKPLSLSESLNLAWLTRLVKNHPLHIKKIKEI